jgi:uncharacterized Fe-S radical SAM superfamily protein PflX
MEYPALTRPITRKEYLEANELARTMGLHRLDHHNSRLTTE